MNSSNTDSIKQPADDGGAKNNVCFLCDKPGHFMKKCPNKRQENKRQENRRQESVGKTASTKQVTDDLDLRNLLLFDSGEWSSRTRAATSER